MKLAAADVGGRVVAARAEIAAVAIDTDASSTRTRCSIDPPRSERRCGGEHLGIARDSPPVVEGHVQLEDVLRAPTADDRRRRDLEAQSGVRKSIMQVIV